MSWRSIVRFNVSDNDSRRSRSYGGLWVRSDGNGITGLKVYNNTVRMGPWSNQAAYIDGNGVEAEFRNNILVGCGGAAPLVVEHPQETLRFLNNLYWANNAPLKIQWGEKTYPDLTGWRQATGQEFLDGRTLGVIADPQLPAASIKTPGINGEWRQRLAAYKPKRESAILSQGIAVGAEVSKAKDCSDILGGVLTIKSWPLGAIGGGSM